MTSESKSSGRASPRPEWTWVEHAVAELVGDDERYSFTGCCEVIRKHAAPEREALLACAEALRCHAGDEAALEDLHDRWAALEDSGPRSPSDLLRDETESALSALDRAREGGAR